MALRLIVIECSPSLAFVVRSRYLPSCLLAFHAASRVTGCRPSRVAGDPG